MIIPIRCMSCGAVIADKWLYYQKKVAEMKISNEKNKVGHKNFDEIQTKTIMDELDLHRYCCRRMFLGHVDLIDEI